jgi:NADH dehydrogenase
VAEEVMQRIVVLGGGFAGLWSAVGAARRCRELGISGERIEIVLVDRGDWHGIRVRNYEADISDARVPFDEVLGPIGVRRVRGEVLDIDPASRRVEVTGLAEPLGYDRLVFALGSRLARPPLPGLALHGFDVDTYESAARLGDHLAGLPARAASAGRDTVLVVGAGLTGIEVASEMKARLAALGGGRVILADQAPAIGAGMGDGACAVIGRALQALGVETRAAVRIGSLDAAGATLADGQRIDAATIVWCGGMEAHPLTACLSQSRDRSGRLPVDAFLRVAGRQAEFAAGDVASLMVDDTHASIMSCQHARPMGRFAGYNAVSDLVGAPMLPLSIPWYVTVLDLGAWGALYTEGWERQVVLEGAAAKRVKQTINCVRIYPPRSGDADAILAAAAPVVQAPPPMAR